MRDITVFKPINDSALATTKVTTAEEFARFWANYINEKTGSHVTGTVENDLVHLQCPADEVEQVTTFLDQLKLPYGFEG